MPKNKCSASGRNKTIGLWHNRQNKRNRHEQDRADRVPLLMLPNHLYEQMTPAQTLMFSVSFLMTLSVLLPKEPGHSAEETPTEPGNFTQRH